MKSGWGLGCGAVVVVVALLLTVLSAEPILFPDDPEFPSYKDRTTTTTRAPVVVHSSRHKSGHGGRSQSGTDPNRKKQLTSVSSSRRAQRNFRFDRREQQGRHAAPMLVGLLPSSGDLRSQSSRRTIVTTRDGTPVVMEMGANVSRMCPRPMGRWHPPNRMWTRNCTIRGKFPIMRQCDKYLECSFSIGYVRSCPPGTMFDYRSTTCNFPYRVHCVDDFELHDGRDDQLSAASTLPPLTPSVMERPTAKLNSDGSVSAVCPMPAGMFAIPGRCGEFLNCWDGRGYVQQCAPGTLFNCHTEKCDFPYKVRCVQQDMPQPPMIDLSEFARTLSGGVAPRSRFGAVMAPPSGQRLRIRGGRSLSQGHVQLYHEGQWNHICENGFTRHMADTICWDLGFSRGSEKLNMQTSMRFKLNENARLLSLLCTGRELHVHECQKRAQETCKVVGVRCQENSFSACPSGYRKFEDHCYKVHPSEPKSREDAMRTCDKEGATLVTIESQAESDFVSEMLQYLPNIGCLHTSGVGVSVFRRQVWIWESTGERVQFERWWPGWSRRAEGRAPSLGQATKCVVLQNVFPAPPVGARRSRTQVESTRKMDSGYFWWTTGACEEELAFVCEAPESSIGCMRRRGSDYKGEATTTESGKACLKWTDPLLRDLTRQLNLNTADIGDHNFCRNPDGDDRPWCFISSGDYDFCDIPRCKDTEDTRAMEDTVRSTAREEKENCGENMFQCRPGECKFFSWVCDGEEDCSNGRDESECHDHLQDYKSTPGVRLVGYDVEKWLYTERGTCASRCSETKDFLCRAFNYMDEEQTCYLLDSNVALSGAAEASLGYELYELLSTIPDCGNKFICPSGKCINTTQVCDGRRDCPDNDDEADCNAKIDFDIRLVGGKAANEGRIEVKALGRWGVVCDDLFSIVDGDVICRNLGYPLGAMEIVTNAGFGSGNGRFLMDDLTCRGDEQKVTECDFAGWGKSDCTEAEVAGVKCREAGQPCSANQWKCHNGKCVELVYVCDQVDDCGDFSDEEDDLCKLPLQARLVGGTNSSGRVELRYKGVWGTACDDDFDNEDAQVVCRMLGFEGTAIVHENAKFGPGNGQIWLDQVNCQGKEKSIDECYHLPWGQSNCAHEEDVGVECTATSTRFKAATPSSGTSSRTPLPESCGHRIVPDTPIVPLDQNPKIVSGKTTEPGSHPWMVGVRIRAGAETAHWCGAVIVSEYHIISAAHCLLDYPQQVYVLRVGDYDNQVEDAEEQEFTIERMYPHPEFNKGTYLNNDIVIIRVKPVRGRGIVFGRQVQPVCLSPPDVQYKPGKKCTIAGWGSTGRSAGYARRLQSVVLPLLPISTCTAPHVYGSRKITDGMYCAGYLEGGIDTCQGDSGGPMVCQHNGASILYGVTSWGQGCARPNKPGVYTKITSYLNWIHRTVEEDGER